MSCRELPLAPFDFRTLLLIRHGEDIGNEATAFLDKMDTYPEERKALYQQKIDTYNSILDAIPTGERPLTERGERQVAHLKKWVEEFDAKQPPIRKLLHLYVSDYLRAVQTAALLEISRAKWVVDPRLEEKEDPTASVHSFLESISGVSATGTVVVVAHANVITSFMKIIDGQSLVNPKGGHETCKDDDESEESEVYLPNVAVVHYQHRPGTHDYIKSFYVLDESAGEYNLVSQKHIKQQAYKNCELLQCIETRKSKYLSLLTSSLPSLPSSSSTSSSSIEEGE